MSTTTALSSLRPRLLRVWVADRDLWPSAAPIALGALILAVILATFGLPSVDLHGPLHRFGVMDPLCGGTRAAYAVIMGHWGRAWAYNPGIFALAAGCSLALVRWLYGRVSGRWLSVSLPRRASWAVIVVAVGVLEVNQQLHAGLLMQR